MNWWKAVPDLWKGVIALVAGITMVIGTYRTVDSYYTKRCDFDAHKTQHDKDIAQVSQAFQKAQIRQDLRWNSKEQYDLRNRLKVNPNDEAARERLEQLEREKEEMERDLKEVPATKILDVR